MIVQGSQAFGGRQPDYFIDFQDSQIKRLFRFVDELKEGNFPIFKKIRKIQNFLGYQFIPRWDPKDERYLALIKKFRKLGEPISLGAYAVCGAGVCREFSMLTHLALTQLGVDSVLVYGVVKHDQGENEYFEGSHGFCLIKYKGELWIIDTYFPWYNGFRFVDAQKRKGILLTDKRLPLGNLVDRRARRVLKLHKFPIVWSKSKSSDCLEKLAEIADLDYP